MLLVTVIAGCDARPDCTMPRPSLLSMPLGTGTVLDHLCRTVGTVGSRDIWILDDAAGGMEERSTVTSPGFGDHEGHVRRFSMSEFRRALAELEPSDLVLFLNPRHWPLGGFGLDELTREAARFPGALHAVAVGADRSGAIERVHCDETGRVRRIRRFYAGVTQMHRHRGVVTHSLVPVAAIQDLEFAALDLLPSRLAAAGVITRDMPFHTDLVDPTNEREYAALSERVLFDVLEGVLPADFSRLDQGVLSGRGAMVHESAKIRGPVILQRGAVVEAESAIIGPAVIGENAVISRGAVVVQSVVHSDAVVPAGTTQWHGASSAPFDLATPLEPSQGSNGNNARPTSSESAFRGEGESTAPDDLPDPMAGDGDLEETCRAGRVGLACKRAFDVVISLATLLVTLPVMLVTALVIKLDSPGPVFFIHRREGRFGKSFPCLKFRTMIVDAHHRQRQLLSENMLDGPHFKMSRDPRVTRVGSVLRKFNIDELPQLVNVLLGQMSLVGPRPSPFRENQFCIPWRKARLSIRPGVTGIWQVCRTGRQNGDFQQWIYFDMMYVRHMTPWLDLKIMAATVVALVTGREVPLNRLISEKHARHPDALAMAPEHRSTALDRAMNRDGDSASAWDTLESVR